MENNSSGGGKLIISVIIILVVIVGGWLLLREDNDTGSLPENGNATTTPIGGTASTTPGLGSTVPVTDLAATVSLTAAGFSPKTVTIKQGQAVKWVNNSGSDMWVGSAMHPDHVVYSGTPLSEHCPDTEGMAFDQCAAGDEFTFTFTKPGTWNYHNHSDATKFGTVVVTE